MQPAARYLSRAPELHTRFHMPLSRQVKAEMIAMQRNIDEKLDMISQILKAMAN